MKVAGIDGCRSGWVVVFGTRGSWKIEVISSLVELYRLAIRGHIFIDIPIGLSSMSYERTADQYARNELKPFRASTVFTPPCREALLETDDFKRAIRINRKISGKGFSIQAWNLRSKILETEKFILASDQVDLKEAHPEVCFKYLNEGAVLMSKKKTDDGARERISLIREWDPTLSKLIEKQTRHPEIRVALDDYIDAACLALSADLAARQHLVFCGGHRSLDARGIHVGIAYGHKAAVYD